MSTKLLHSDSSSFHNNPSTDASEQLDTAQQFAGLELGQILGIGAYSFVQEAIDKSSNQIYAIKFAAPSGQIPSPAVTGCFVSRPLTQMTGSYGDINLDSAEFLLKQYQGWKNVKCKGWPTVYETIRVGGKTAAIMDKVQGITLRKIMNSGSATLEHFSALCKVLGSLEQFDSKLKHGDLKPENILIDDSSSSSSSASVFVIDPGYFGRIAINDNKPIQIAMTTPDYYPFLEADDIFAVGIILLELLSGRNLLAFESASAELPDEVNRYKNTVGESLTNKIKSGSRSNNYFPSGLYNLPSFLSAFESKIPDGLCTIALKCLGIVSLEGGTLTTTQQFANFSELNQALAKMF